MTREQNRQIICLICKDKAKLMFHIKDGSHLHGLVKEFVMENFITYDNRLPRALCSSCRGKLVAFGQGDFNPVLPQLPSWESMSNFRIRRGDQDFKCQCEICNIARTGFRRGQRRKLKKLQVGIKVEIEPESIIIYYDTFHGKTEWLTSKANERSSSTAKCSLPKMSWIHV